MSGNKPYTIATGPIEGFFEQGRDIARKLDRGETVGPARIISFEDPDDMLEDEGVDYRDAFPEFVGKESQTAIRVYRMREDLTRQQMADISGIPASRIADLEHGKGQATPEESAKLAQVLNVDVVMLRPDIETVPGERCGR